MQAAHAAGASAGSASNYGAAEVASIDEHMAARGWARPQVYQGMYNALTRDVEAELLPLLRERGIAFYAYNPLAGGLLTGKHLDRLGGAAGAAGSGGRFDGNDFYVDRYWRREYFDALRAVRAACDGAGGGLSLAESAIRWLAHHSALRGGEGDGIVVGGSSVSQLEANLAACAAGPMPPPVASAWDDAWRRRARRRVDGYGLSGSMRQPRAAAAAAPDGGREAAVTLNVAAAQ